MAMDMNHGSSAMSMATSAVMNMASATTGMVMASTTAGGMAGMEGMGPSSTAEPMDMEDMMGGCKISMLWNWNTIDSCFISSSWQIKSAGMMAGSCIGVILLVMTLELLRRASKEYDRYLIKQSALAHSHSTTIAAPSYNSSDNNSNKGALATSTPAQEAGVPVKRTVRPTIFQQAVRATLHMVQFTIAYFVMLLAMYYNGYLIISIIIGAWLGAFVFSWGNLDVGGPKEDSTYCCG